MLENGANAERAVFPALSMGSAVLSNCLVGRNLSFSAEVMGEERQFSLTDTAKELGQACRTFRCHIGDCDTLLSVSDDQAHRLLPRLAAEAAIGDLPDPLVMAIGVVGLRPLLTELSAYLGAPSSLDEIDEEASVDWPQLFLCEMTGANEDPVAVLHVDPAGLKSLGLLIAAVPPASQWDGADHVPVKLKAQFWRGSMTPSEIASLACGDIILLPEGYSADRVDLFAGEGNAPIGIGKRNGSSITVEELKGTAMADQSEAQAMEAQPPNDEVETREAAEEEISSDEDQEDDVSDAEGEEQADDQYTDDSEESEGASGGGVVDTEELSVPIAFSLGHGMVSIANLRSLGPGYVFSLESEPGAEVEIVAGGKEIGRGEIVQIADRLGVRIVKLEGDSDA